MWLGCGAHHAHADDVTCRHHSRAAANAEAHSHAGHNHDAESESECPPDKSPFPAERCGECHCVFLSAGKTDMAKPTSVALLPVFARESVAILLGLPTSAFFDTGGFVGPPTRLHLFNQVLLI
jgi:hypothetical protein